MTTVEAINVLLQGVEAGRKHAIYTFQDAALIYEAITVLTGKNQKEEEATKKADGGQNDFAFDDSRGTPKKKNNMNEKGNL
jgi:hypothetical protein